VAKENKTDEWITGTVKKKPVSFKNVRSLFNFLHHHVAYNSGYHMLTKENSIEFV
jgi:hypothetical protein